MEKEIKKQTTTEIKTPKPNQPRKPKVKSCDDNHTIGMMRVFGRL